MHFQIKYFKAQGKLIKILLKYHYVFRSENKHYGNDTTLLGYS